MSKSKNQNVLKTKKERMVLSSNCEVCGSKTSRFIKQQEAIGLLSSLGIRTPSNKIPLIGPFFILGVLKS